MHEDSNHFFFFFSPSSGDAFSLLLLWRMITLWLNHRFIYTKQKNNNETQMIIFQDRQ